MAGSTLTYTLVGEDKSASKAMKGVGDAAQQSAKKTESSWKSAGVALSALAIAKFGSDSVKAFTEAQEATQRLEDAFSKFPKLGDSSAASIEKITSALQKKTKFDDDATNAAAGTLAQFDLTGKQIENLLPLLQDYATATGKDIGDAATSLGKSFMGQTRALKEVGINYTSTGDKAKDFTNITELLSAKVGGFAENQGKTAAGQLAILKNQFGDVQEAIGGALVPALTQAGKVIIPVVEGVGSAVQWFAKLPGPIKAAAGALVALKLASKSDMLTGLASSLKSATTTAGGFKSALGSIGKKLAIAGAIVLIGSLVDAMGEASRKSKQAATDVQSVADVLTGSAGQINDANRQQYIDALRASEAYKTLTAAHISDGDAIDYLSGKTSAQVISQQRANMSFDDAQKVLVGLAEGAGLASGAAQKTAAAMDETNRAAAAAAAATETHTKAQASFAAGLDVDSDRIARGNDALHDQAIAHADATAASMSYQQVLRDNAAANEADAAAVDKAQAAYDKAKAALTPYAQQLQDAADANSDLAQATSEVITQVDKLAGRVPTAEQAISDMHAATDALAKSAGVGTEGFKAYSTAIVKSSGEIDTASESGRQYRDDTIKARDAIVAAGEAEYKRVASTKGAKAAMEAANKVVQQGVKDWKDNSAAAFGGGEAGKAASEKVAKGYNLIPKVIETAIKTDAKQSDEATAKSKKKLDDLNGAKANVLITGDNSDAQAKADSTDRKWADLQGKTSTLHLNATADTSSAEGSLSYLFNSWNGKAVHLSVGVTQAHAAGGTITGGTPGKDSVHAMLMPGEEVVNTAAASKGNNRAVLKAMNAGMLHFASGGSVPGFNFRGASAPNLGERQGNVVGAFGDLASWIKDLGSAAKDTAADARDAAHSLRVAQNTQRSELAETRKSNSERSSAAKRARDEVVKDNAERLKSAKTAEQRAKVAKDNADRLAKANDKVAAASKKNADALAKTTAEQNKKVAAAKREADATAKSARAADAKSDAESRVYAQTARTRTLLSAASKVYDQYNAKLATEKDKLADLKSSRASLAGSVAGNISGIGGGILGYSDLRTNPSSILSGLQYNLKGQTAYTKNLAALKAKGLSSALLSQIAQGGDDGQRVAASLAGASKQQIDQINKTQAAIDKNAAAGGNLVAGSAFDKQIAAQQKVVESTAKTANAALDAINAFSTALTKGFKLDISAQGVATLNARGVADLRRRGVKI